MTLASLAAVGVDLAEAMTRETSEWHNLIHGRRAEAYAARKAVVLWL
jgi:hypothetical protein